MGFPHLTSGQVPQWGRLVVLFVFAAGFFTMHGFLAMSASAHVQGSHGVQQAPQHGTSSASDAEVAHVGSTADGAAFGGADSNGVVDRAMGPSGEPVLPVPAEHHDLLAGCVVALVGIAVIGLSLLSRSGVRAPAGAAACRSVTGQEIRSAASRWSPPRVALCVIRV